MKSIFFVAVFIILAITVSKPEEAEIKYVPVNISVPHSFMQNDLNKDFSVNFVPKDESKSYEIEFNKEITSIINSSVANFPFNNCELKHRPNISLSCNLKEFVPATSQIISLSIRPMITIGQEKVDFYVLQISKLSVDGEISEYQFFTKPKHISSGADLKAYKVTQN